MVQTIRLSWPATWRMHQYLSRRRRCWKLLNELDPEIVLSEGHRSDMLLDLAGLDMNNRTMIQSSIGKAYNFVEIADALVVQNPCIHLTEGRTTGFEIRTISSTFVVSRPYPTQQKGVQAPESPELEIPPILEFNDDKDRQFR